MRKKGLIITLISVFIIAFLIYLVIYITPQPPVNHIEKARIAVSNARKAQSETYAKELFKAAIAAYDQALAFLESENNRFILFRDYDKVDSSCKVTIENAEKAIHLSRINSQNLETALDERIHELNTLVKNYGELMSKFPVSKVTRQSFLNGKMLLAEAITDFKKKHYTDSDSKARKAEILLRESTSSLRLMLESYFENYSMWINWYNSSLKKSKQSRTYLVVVDKTARVCQVYKNGKIKKTFSIELGKNWLGDKRHKGDKTTPEGLYLVKKKLDSNKTKYFKALLLNYPNEDDVLRFEQEKKNGTLPAHADIGGLIEIHGHGGKGVDWTDGCIALEDDDIAELFNMIEVSTPVTIVGSLVPLHVLMKD